MIKIAMFCDNVQGGGILEHCRKLKKLLEESKLYTVSLFSEITFKQIYLFKKYNLKEIKKILLSEKFDFIHIHGFITPLPFFVFKCLKQLELDVPVVYTPHAHPFYTLNHPKMNKVFFNIFVKQCFIKANCIIANNDDDYVFFREFNDNVIKVCQWMDYNFDRKIMIPERIENNKKKILFVGRNEANKDINLLYNLPKDEFQVICVTDKRPSREDFVYKTNLTKDELYELYRNVDLTVIPSRYESFSSVAMESLCNGTPILISDRVKIIDFIKDCEGYTVFKYSVYEDFYSKINDAINKKINTNNYITDIFSKDRAFNIYSKIFKN